MSYFNVRVYGLLVNENREVLLSDEREYGMDFIKFPGGGVEHGEGLLDALKREFMEECGIEIKILAHFYTTDFYEKSAFNDSQVISIYYLVAAISALKLNTKSKAFDFDDGTAQSFRWVSISDLEVDMVTFKTDQQVVRMLKNFSVDGR